MDLDKLQTAWQHLTELLPLVRRQQALPSPLAELHRAILRDWVEGGQPPDWAALRLRWPDVIWNMAQA